MVEVEVGVGVAILHGTSQRLVGPPAWLQDLAGRTMPRVMLAPRRLHAGWSLAALLLACSPLAGCGSSSASSGPSSDAASEHAPALRTDASDASGDTRQRDVAADAARTSSSSSSAHTSDAASDVASDSPAIRDAAHEAAVEAGPADGGAWITQPAANQIVATCSNVSLALTVFDDGVVRLRYLGSPPVPDRSFAVVATPDAAATCHVTTGAGKVTVETALLELTVEQQGCAVQA